MCGIALIVGPEAGARRREFDAMMRAIQARGESQETDISTTSMIGTARLKIVDREHAVQPWQSRDGRTALCYNGEIFNHGTLREELRSGGVDMRSLSDTEVVLESFLAWGEDALLKFRAEFAFAILERDTGRVFLARDPVGVKPLYWARGHGLLYIASEVKAFVGLGLKVHELPPGFCGWASADADPEVHPYIDLFDLGRDEAALTSVEEASAELRRVYRESVALRVDTDLTVGVILSGGLDSSLTLIHVKEMHPDCVAFTVGAPGSPDLEYARRLTADLGVRHVVVELRPSDIKLADAREAVRVCEATEYGDVINAVVSLKVFEAARDAGVKVVLTGDGSDELFGGYDMYQDIDDALARDLFLHKIRHLSRTELQRVDRTSMGRQVEARVPFLDIDMLRLAMRIPFDLKVRDGYEKWIVRHAFSDVLPDYIKARHKNPMSRSSGLHERVRLFRPLMPRWYRGFGYEALGPMRRDFSVLLAAHDHDLSAAVAASEAAEDYTLAERARDFAGAVKWNLPRPWAGKTE